MAETQVRKPKLRDLPLEERLEGYLQIEYQKALDDFILMLDMNRPMVEPFYKHVYVSFLSRILGEHTGVRRFPGLKEFKKQVEACGIKAEMGYKYIPYFRMAESECNCVMFSVGEVELEMVQLGTIHFLSIWQIYNLDARSLWSIPASELIDCIRLSLPFLPRIRKMVAEAEEQAPAVAMVRKIRRITRITKKRAALQESEDTGV